ncbi:uncharacterized protein ATC70_010267 [Mucor velutinosus]|uniref:Uncharacterized protein n=1 Tax=Mucor velutinosus TaxID=708070 RepID=A0AAN7DEG8_9FUNG|nr:hypothetical protein ATC70_010267 [Mucor velutinosus]
MKPDNSITLSHSPSNSPSHLDNKRNSVVGLFLEGRKRQLIEYMARCVNQVEAAYARSSMENRTQSITKEEKIDLPVDRRHGYNADSILRLSNAGMEIFVSEVSSRYGTEEKDRHAIDHSRGMFAQLSMLEAIADKYEYATVEALLKQKALFPKAYNRCACVANESCG